MRWQHMREIFRNLPVLNDRIAGRTLCTGVCTGRARLSGAMDNVRSVCLAAIAANTRKSKQLIAGTGFDLPSNDAL